MIFSRALNFFLEKRPEALLYRKQPKHSGNTSFTGEHTQKKTANQTPATAAHDPTPGRRDKLQRKDLKHDKKGGERPRQRLQGGNGEERRRCPLRKTEARVFTRRAQDLQAGESGASRQRLQGGRRHPQVPPLPAPTAVRAEFALEAPEPA